MEIVSTAVGGEPVTEIIDGQERRIPMKEIEAMRET
jgi:hypothetical protein